MKVDVMIVVVLVFVAHVIGVLAGARIERWTTGQILREREMRARRNWRQHPLSAGSYERCGLCRTMRKDHHPGEPGVCAAFRREPPL